MSKTTTRAIRLSLLAALCLVLTVPAAGQDLRATLFTDADALISQGKELRSDLLAPKSWGKGLVLPSVSGPASIASSSARSSVSVPLRSAKLSRACCSSCLSA